MDSSAIREPTPEHWPACGHCRTRYRPPQWGREYSCPNCLQPLNPARSGLAGSAAPVVWVVAAGAAVLAGGIYLRTAADRSLTRTAPRPPTPVVEAPADPRIELPPRMTEHLREKFQILESEVALEPDNQGLLSAAGETALSLAVCDRATGRSPQWRSRAAELIRRLSALNPGAGAQLALLLQNEDRLYWAQRDDAGLAANLWPYPGGPLLFGAAPSFAPSGAGARHSSGPSAGFSYRARVGVLEPGRNRAATPGNGPGMGPAAGPVAGAPNRGWPGLGGFSAGPAGAPDSRSGSGAPRDENQGAAQPWRPTSSVEALRAALAARPGDPQVVTDLGYALMALPTPALRPDIEPEGSDRPRPSARLAEATAIFRSAAARARTRTLKAWFLRSSAEAERRGGHWEAAFALLREAVRKAPFSADLWKELETAAMHTGRLEVADEAHRNAREWRLPELRAPSHPAPDLPPIQVPIPVSDR